MWFPILSALWRSRSEHRPVRRKPASTRLSVEALEDRTVLSTNLFTAASVSELIADISKANQTGGSNTITLEPGVKFTLTTVNNDTDGPTGLPVIAAGDNLTIVGNGDTIERSTAKGTPAFRLFDVAAGASLTAQSLTLQGGLAFGWGVYAAGGAVYNQGTLTLDGVTIQNNTAQGGDGLNPGFVRNGGTVLGGGLYSIGALTVTGSTIQNNSAIGGRGAGAFYYSSDPGATGSYRVPGANGGNAFGGGLYVGGGTVTFSSSTILSNTAQGGAGGSSGGNKGQGIGGGIYIDAAAWVGLDGFTVVRRNHASTSDNDIFGSYAVIP